MIYYGTNSDIRVKCYWRLNFLRSSIFNFECLDILWDSIGHPSKKLLPFEFAKVFCFLFRASRYIMGLNWTSQKKVIAVLICSGLLFFILSVSIYYGTQSDIRVKSYCHLSLLGASILNFEHLDILQYLVRLPSKKLLPFEFVRVFHFIFWFLRYMNGLNCTSE